MTSTTKLNTAESSRGDAAPRASSSGEHKAEGGYKVLPGSYQPTQFDVICGRGKGHTKWNGNKHLLSISNKHLPEFVASGKSKLKKTRVVTAIVNEVRKRLNGKFVQKLKGDRWVEISEDRAREKVGYTLRGLLQVWMKGQDDQEDLTASSDSASLCSEISSAGLLSNPHMGTLPKSLTLIQTATRSNESQQSPGTSSLVAKEADQTAPHKLRSYPLLGNMATSIANPWSDRLVPSYLKPLLLPDKCDTSKKQAMCLTGSMLVPPNAHSQPIANVNSTTSTCPTFLDSEVKYNNTPAREDGTYYEDMHWLDTITAVSPQFGDSTYW